MSNPPSNPPLKSPSTSIDTQSKLIATDLTTMQINIQSELIVNCPHHTNLNVYRPPCHLGQLEGCTLTLSTIRGNHRTLVDHYTVCINTDCINTDCIDADCTTLDCINANHVDTYNCDTIFCDAFNRACKYARVMSSLDFDNVKSNKSSSNIPGSILAGLLMAPMAYQISWSKRTCNSPIDSKFPLKKDQRILKQFLKVMSLTN